MSLGSRSNQCGAVPLRMQLPKTKTKKQQQQYEQIFARPLTYLMLLYTHPNANFLSLIMICMILESPLEKNKSPGAFCYSKVLQN